MISITGNILEVHGVSLDQASNTNDDVHSLRRG